VSGFTFSAVASPILYAHRRRTRGVFIEPARARGQPIGTPPIRNAEMFIPFGAARMHRRRKLQPRGFPRYWMLTGKDRGGVAI